MLRYIVYYKTMEGPNWALWTTYNDEESAVFSAQRLLTQFGATQTRIVPYTGPTPPPRPTD